MIAVKYATVKHRYLSIVPHATIVRKQMCWKRGEKMAETYYTIRQVAELHNVAYQTIWEMIRHGELDAIRIRSVWRIPESALGRLTQGRNASPEVQAK